MKLDHIKAYWITSAAFLFLFAPCPARAQFLLHRYSFTGNANDSIAGANGTVVGSVTFQTDANSPASAGIAVFPGGTSSANPSYIRLPSTTVIGLRNGTIEIFTTYFATPGAAFQALFSAGTNYPSTTNYLILAANRAGAGVGVGARKNNLAEVVSTSMDPLPDGIGNHVVHLVYSGFTTVGSTGTQTIYVDGEQVAQKRTVYCLANVASGSGGLGTVGLGGGAPFNDPTFIGNMDEVRIYDGPLTPAQIIADISAGPNLLGFTPIYTFTEAIRTLQIAAGIGTPATPQEKARLNIETPVGSATVADILDALRIARKAAGTDANP